MKNKKNSLMILSFLLLFMLPKSGNTQNEQNSIKKQDSKEKHVKFSKAQQSLYIEIEGFSFTTNGNTQLKWTPLMVIKPTITFNDKLCVGFTTTQMVQNYTTENMTSIMHDMFAHAKLNINKDFNIFLNVGYFSALNYAGEFATFMPISYFFENAIVMHSGHYLQTAGMVGVSNKNFSFGAGYKEDKKFQINGGGDIVVVGEAFFEKFKIGTLWMFNSNKCIGDLQIAYNPNDKNSGLLEFTNICNKDFSIHMIYNVKVHNNAMLFINTYTQINDGPKGVHVGIRFSSTGIYVAIGGTYHDFLLKNSPEYNRFAPMIEIGIRQGFLQLLNNFNNQTK